VSAKTERVDNRTKKMALRVGSDMLRNMFVVTMKSKTAPIIKYHHERMQQWVQVDGGIPNESSDIPWRQAQ
jgi:hypothetical protein